MADRTEVPVEGALPENLPPEDLSAENLSEGNQTPPRTRHSSIYREQTTFSEYLESLLVTIILALFGTSFIVQAFKIPSASMEKTLLIGDHLLVNKFIFGGQGAWYEKLLPYRSLQRGDIIVFKYPYLDHPHYVKRVIG
jgi:signal peptidase I